MAPNAVNDLDGGRGDNDEKRCKDKKVEAGFERREIMGLDISSKNKSYHAGYYALHMVRRMALLTCGFPESRITDYPNVYIFTDENKPPSADEYCLIMQACSMAGYLYPNLLLHSDSGGKYTKRGKPLDGSWETGNSPGFLKELKDLQHQLPKKFKTGRAWEIYEMLYAVVEDAVKNNQVIEFH